MLRSLSIGIAMLGLAGCVTAKDAYLPDGRLGHTINCSGTALTWDACFQRAGEICQAKGYDVVSQVGDSASTISGNQFGVYGGTVATRTLLIGCRAEKPAAQ